MSARKMSGCRSIRTLNLIRQATIDHADAVAGELYCKPLRGKLRASPNAWDDLPITNNRKFYRIYKEGPRPKNFDSHDKILRLLRRREARKIAMLA